MTLVDAGSQSKRLALTQLWLPLPKLRGIFDKGHPLPPSLDWTCLLP